MVLALGVHPTRHVLFDPGKCLTLACPIIGLDAPIVDYLISMVYANFAPIASDNVINWPIKIYLKLYLIIFRQLTKMNFFCRIQRFQQPGCSASPGFPFSLKPSIF